MTFPRSLSLRSIALLAALMAIQATAPLARAQIVELAEPIPVTDDLATVFEKGSRLEGERKWAEALSFYEEALRKHPTRTELQQRVTVSRAHYDVSRRYGDTSYTAALDQLRDRDALAIYDEVLLKIQSNYVHEPKWQQIVYAGLTNLEVALTEPAFVTKNLPRVPADRLGGLQRAIRQLTTARRVDDRNQALAHIASIGRTLDQQYGLPSQAVILEFASGAAAALDEYSGFLTGGQMDEVFSQIEGNFVGLGVELKTEPAGLLIVNVIPTGPAAQGGIKPGERIIEVDGKTTADCLARYAGRHAPRRQKGARSRWWLQNEAGEPRRLQPDAPPRRSAQRRASEDRRSAAAHRLFQADQLPEDDQPRRRCGPVEAARARDAAPDHRPPRQPRRPPESGRRCGRQVRDGRADRRHPRPQPARGFRSHAAQIAGTWRVPLVVLIDHDSASASEIFAGAIRDHRRGTVVGEKSYGKGSVQGIFPLAAANVGMRLTTAKWYTPSGQAISGAG